MLRRPGKRVVSHLLPSGRRESVGGQETPDRPSASPVVLLGVVPSFVSEMRAVQSGHWCWRAHASASLRKATACAIAAFAAFVSRNAFSITKS